MIDNTINIKFLKANENQGLNEITTENIIKDIKSLIELAATLYFEFWS